MSRKFNRHIFLPFFVTLLVIGTGCEAEQPTNAASESPATNPEPEPQKEHSIHWSYGGEVNPTRWGEVSPEFALCETGTAQSPVNIEKASKQQPAKIELNYQPTPLEVINTGHTIQVNYAPGSFVNIDGKQYELLQFHFHTPSEHNVEKNAYAMELHFVHRNEQDKLAVVGVFIKEGKPNDSLETIWQNMPQTQGENKLDSVQFNASNLLPSDLTHYSYIGSLTTPPCSEGVSWNILTTPIEASEEQISEFMAIYNVNARPIQPLNDRAIELNQ